MCSGAILPKMLLFAIPLMCSSILQLLFNAADIIVVGRYAGDNSLAAVGSNTSLIGLLTNLFIGLSIGTNVLAARYYGAKAEDDLAKTVHTSIVLGIASGILLSVIVLSVLFYRPFCKWLCPLGAFYALFNRVSLFQMKVDKNKCVSCGKCARACKMDVDVTKTPNHTECIRCGMCVRACPTKAVCFRYGFGSGKETTKKTTMEESK